MLQSFFFSFFLSKGARAFLCDFRCLVWYGMVLHCIWYIKRGGGGQGGMEGFYGGADIVRYMNHVAVDYISPL